MILGIDASRANKKERTGVEWCSYFLISEFKRLIPPGICVRLYLQNPPSEDLLPLPPNWEARILRWPFRFWTIFRLSAEMLAHKPDILFSPANILPFFTPKKTFTIIHDTAFSRFPECYSPAEARLQDFGVRRALKKALAVFSPSEFTKRELIEIYGAAPKKISVTPLGHSPLSLDKERRGEVDIRNPYFLFIGRKDAKKNIAGIIGAFKIFSVKNPSYSLVLAGPDKLQFTNYDLRITNIGWINPEEKQALLKNCEALVFPSLYEGFGLPILEAFAAGAPVITANRASMPEIAGNAALLVNPENPAEIAEAMEKIIKNSALRAELIQKGFERAKKFSWQKCAEQIMRSLGCQN